MIYSDEPFEKATALGIYLSFRLLEIPPQDADELSHALVMTQNLGNYRFYVNVAFPKNQQDNRLMTAYNAIINAECGHHWPIHVDKCNISTFFSPDDIENLEKKFSYLTFYAHTKKSKNFDSDKMSYRVIHQAGKSC